MVRIKICLLTAIILDEIFPYLDDSSIQSSNVFNLVNIFRKFSEQNYSILDEEGSKYLSDNNAFDDHSHMANVYKCLLRHRMANIDDDNLLKSNLKLFLDILENDAKVRLLYADISDLFDDFVSLYNQFQMLKNKIESLLHLNEKNENEQKYHNKYAKLSKVLENANEFIEDSDNFYNLDKKNGKI